MLHPRSEQAAMRGLKELDRFRRCASASVLLCHSAGKCVMMVNALVRNVARQMMVLATPIKLEGTIFCIKKVFNMFLKQVKSMLDIRLALEEIDPSITTKIIQEAHIIFKTSHR
jgi:hypothetical protein